MNVTDFLIKHGYTTLFVGVLAEQIGLPVPAAALLLAAGALVGLHRLNLATVLLLAIIASLASDSLWFFLGRRRGSTVLDHLCRLSLEPETCVSKTNLAYTRYGPKSLLVSKFAPGLGTLGPAMAGMFGLAPWKFILFDAGGALTWSGSIVALGWVFRQQLEILASALAKFGVWAGIALGVGLALYGAFKYVRRRRIFRALRTARVTPGELKRLIDAGEKPTIVDLRTEFERRGGAIPGAIALTYESIELLPAPLASGEVILYCSCPNEITSVRAALRLKRRGVQRVRPLEGGFPSWRDLGFPVEAPMADAPG